MTAFAYSLSRSDKCIYRALSNTPGEVRNPDACQRCAGGTLGTEMAAAWSIWHPISAFEWFLEVIKWVNRVRKFMFVSYPPSLIPVLHTALELQVHSDPGREHSCPWEMALSIDGGKGHTILSPWHPCYSHLTGEDSLTLLLTAT